METLSIRQPWAYLICAGYKPIENRVWKTNYRGKILVHASGGSDGKGWDFYTQEQIEYIVEHIGADFFKRDFLMFAIVGSVDIVDCYKATANQKYDSVFAEYNCYNWKLANPVLFDEPILNVKGKLKIWDYPS